MTKRYWILGLCLAGLAFATTGCDLYTGSDDYYYCDDTGCYYCDDWGCYPDGGNPPGWECTDNDDCAGGCYCTDQGYCEEAGFCENDTDCPVGFECDDRSSCVPEGGDGGVRGCTSDDQCPGDYVCNQDNGLCEEFVCGADTDCEAGSYCDEDTGACIESGSCENPGQDTCAEGFECDVSRQSCMPDDGVCTSDAECGSDDLKCDTEETNTCVAKECADYDDWDSCQAQGDACQSLINLSNCTDTGGGTCSEQTPQYCSCSDAAFIECRDAN